MTLFGYEIRRARAVPPVWIVREHAELTPAELTQALRVSDGHPMMRAVLQLIDQAEADANANAAEDIHLPGTVAACHIGGGKYLRELRAEIVSRMRSGDGKSS